jgi:hypothetical protein
MKYKSRRLTRAARRISISNGAYNVWRHQRHNGFAARISMLCAARAGAVISRYSAAGETKRRRGWLAAMWRIIIISEIVKYRRHRSENRNNGGEASIMAANSSIMW